MKRSVVIVILISIIGLVLSSVLVYERGLYSFWDQSSISRLDAKATERLIKKEAPIILDVRNEEEFEVSHLANAIRYTPDIVEKLNPNEPILVYCTASVRSNSLAIDLDSLGFEQVYELKGGLLHWKNKGFDVVNINGRTTDSIHTYNKWLSKFLKNGKAVY